LDSGTGTEVKAAAKDVDGITKANPGVITYAAGHGYSNGALIYFSGLTEMTSLNTGYKTLTDNSGNTFQLGDLSAATAAETTGGNCSERVTGPGATGMIFYTSETGSVRGLKSNDSGFAYNSAVSVWVER
jgi:hypothetical protein